MREMNEGYASSWWMTVLEGVGGGRATGYPRIVNSCRLLT